ncbi:hypothetical protein LTR85_011221 [Meristemomyces frigidus]|nr:hypothetical protein LTR85_011221 [Meristemomyces frigidus]
MAPTYAADTALLRPHELRSFNDFMQDAMNNDQLDRSNVLASIPITEQSYASLITLSTLLSTVSGTWPVFQLQQIYVRAWKALPEEAKSGHSTPQVQRLLDRTLHQCKQSYSSLLDLLHSSSFSAAIIDPETGRSLSHSDLAASIDEFNLPLLVKPGQPKPVVAISLPNGPLLALTVLATATHYTAAPVAHGSGVGAEQFKADVLQSKSDMVLAFAADVDRLKLRDSWLAAAGVRVLLLDLSEQMRLTISDLDGIPLWKTFDTTAPTPNTADDTGILLFTSGTSGTKKLVPLSIHSMVCGIAMVIDSWGLSPSMRCLNQMPLNHVGGLIRNLFAPVMSGGSVICCSAFDANLFWDCVEDHAPTWYYASPSMHQMILEAGLERPESMSKCRIRLVCNAAGGLLPSLAGQLRDTFTTASVRCTVLPSYGMTECMPISTPPLDYRLEKTGTSGISVGPEISIMDGNYQPMETGTVGRISVRGAPVFGGYLKASNVIDKSCFTEDGWFDTGDMGYLDEAGYLYITGRSKEVINRGGELISPFEVEEAVVAAAATQGSPIYGRVSKALAFSATHDVLQEVVGIAVVTPERGRRACLRDIQDAVKGALSQVKVPVLVVFMDNGLPTNNNKVLRIKLAERLALPEISDSTPQAGRHYEAISPPNNTPLGHAIECSLMQVSHESLVDACQRAIPEEVDFYVRLDASDFYPELLLAPTPGRAQHPGQQMHQETILAELAQTLHGYNVPSKVLQLEYTFPRSPDGDVDDIAVDKAINAKTVANGPSGLTDTETTVAGIFAQILAVPTNDISSTSDFFDLGGSSMAAGQLLSKLRKEFHVRLPIDALFMTRQVSALAALIEEKTGSGKPVSKEPQAGGFQMPELLPGCQETFFSTRPILMLLQLLPMGLLYPMKRALTWTIFMYFLTMTQNWFTNESIPGRLLDLVLAMAVARLVTKAIAPIVAIMFKWLIIGRYQEGLYPMWSSYHTKWWLCQKVIAISGMGLFSMSNTTRVWYYRCLGAKIGRGVSINKGATIGEYDLLTIEDSAVLERCTVRPFAAERNTSMYLGRISIGANAVVGLGSIIAAGTSLPPNACIGPNSSSWEAADSDEANRDLASSRIPGAHWLLSIFGVLGLQVLTSFVAALPWLGCLVALVTHEPASNIQDMLREVTIWFASPSRVSFHYAALSANAALGPAFLFFAVWIIKKVFDLASGGPIMPGDAGERSQLTKFRMELMRTLMSAPTFHKLTELFGTHYEATSILARLMGAKVGKRVYWPGTGPSVQDFSLLDIGSDVVFGSRSHLVTSDGNGSDYVRIKSGAMVADRVVLLPGVELGEKTVMGSGALTKRNVQYAAETTWVGAKQGEAVCLTADTTTTVSTATGPGKRASQYYDTPKMPYNFVSMNSTSTTLVRNFDSEASSIAFAEKGYGLTTYDDIDLSKAGGVSGKGSVAVSVRSVAPNESDEAEESTSPFGRAFYQGQASYRVWGQFRIFCYSTLITIITAIYWNIGSISAVQVVAHAFRYNTLLSKHFLAVTWFRPLSLYVYFTALIMAIMTAQSLAVIGFLVASKWVLMGRRRQGNYDWDKSPYCQRWQLFLKLESLRRHCYGGHGILGMLTGTHWIVLYFRALGLQCGKDCALFAGGLPSLMFTEPDLLTLGDRVSVDDASLVAHINTRGKFDLNPLYVGDRSVLRSGSRLLSGARMEADSCLLEHTLVMAGDVVDAGTTSQGWPAEEFMGDRMPTLKVGLTWLRA